MHKHTPGPWMLHDMEDHTVVTSKKPGQFIALCDAEALDDEACHANACLILAAPELLEALENLCNQIEIGNAIDDHGHELKNLQALYVARNVIAKTTPNA